MNDVQSREDVLVSVVMITYNHEKYISKAIESVLMQKTSFRYELLIGDDASKDKTPEIIRGYKEQNPEIIKTKLRKRNVGGTRNSYELFMNAKGKYIAILEGDDYWTDELKLQKQFDFLEGSTEYSGCCSDFIYVDKEDNPLPENGANRLRRNLYSSNSIYTIAQFNQSKLPSHAGTIMIKNFFHLFDCSILYKAHRIIGDCTIIMLALNCGAIYKISREMEAYRVVKTDSSWTAAEEGNPFLPHDTFMYYTILEVYARRILKMNVTLRNAKERYFFRECMEMRKHISKARLKSIYNMLKKTDDKITYLRVFIESFYYAGIPTTIIDGLLDGRYASCDETWEIFNKTQRGKKIVIAGAGAGLGDFLEQYYLDYNIEFIVDNNELLHGRFKYGYKILPFDELSNIDLENTIVLITTNDDYIDMIRMQCEKYAVKNVFSYVHMECKQPKYNLFRYTFNKKVYLRNV